MADFKITSIAMAETTTSYRLSIVISLSGELSETIECIVKKSTGPSGLFSTYEISTDRPREEGEEEKIWEALGQKALEQEIIDALSRDHEGQEG